MTKKEKVLIKIKARVNEDMLNIKSRNYIPLVNMALMAGACARHLASINTIKTNDGFGRR